MHFLFRLYRENRFCYSPYVLLAKPKICRSVYIFLNMLILSFHCATCCTEWDCIYRCFGTYVDDDASIHPFTWSWPQGKDSPIYIIG